MSRDLATFPSCARPRDELQPGLLAVRLVRHPPSSDRFDKLGDLLFRVGRVQTYPDALLTFRNGRMRDRSDEEAALLQVRSERTRFRRQEWDDRTRVRDGLH